MKKYYLLLLISIYLFNLNVVFAASNYCTKKEATTQKTKSAQYIPPWNSYCENSGKQFDANAILLYRTMFPHKVNFGKLAEKMKFNVNRSIVIENFVKYI